MFVSLTSIPNTRSMMEVFRVLTCSRQSIFGLSLLKDILIKTTVDPGYSEWKAPLSLY